MKKLIVAISFLMVFMLAPVAMADQVTLVGGSGYGPYQTGRGGEFTFRPDTALSWILNAGYVDGVTKNVEGLARTFQTFCVETSEYINAYGTYNASLSDHSINTGKTLTLGAAWLYHQFQTDQLTGYDYSRTRVGGLLPITQQLQDAIWWFMGVYNAEYGTNFQPGSPPPGNQFINLADSTLGGDLSAFGANNGTYPVMVLNLWNNGTAAQDQLVCTPVPEPTTMLIFGSGLVGLAGIIRRRFKK